MANAYPVELRERVVNAYECGDGSYTAVGATFNLGEVTVKRWVTMYLRDGYVIPLKKGGGRHSDVALSEITELLDRMGDVNAGEIAAAYNRNRRGKNRRHVSSIKRALYRAGYVVEKNGYAQRNSCAPTLPQNAMRIGRL